MSMDISSAKNISFPRHQVQTAILISNAQFFWGHLLSRRRKVGQVRMMQLKLDALDFIL